ncbi:hypothetical protein EXU85_14530 [Spirosoma sp. KCTC 42546]|uniref:STN and carboxypeptidase regulatory-like domain-containing protein n=1 Tax=Spirosoma sp. KCTC 42546 TaxID=2520506 RepID=UPI00115A9838|nr:STN and carboxypeptidase regulatory-like domain-containing protein [Spirosoma sp. KCTC 42546]QDK79760.1 hypothetical protein EXU85_14530 [Spirosoma sp. KCTC 42546]
MRHFIFLLYLFVSVRLFAQSVPPLDRVISVDIRNEKIESALRQISRAGHFEFSYNPTRIDGNAVVTLRLVNTPVREVLNRVFQNQVSYKARGNHVILVRADLPEATPKNFLLDGYILDEKTGERIAQASIFEKTTLASTVSNPFGYYRLRLSTDLPTVRLDVRKQAYIGETVLIRSRSTHSVSIRMTPIPARLAVETLPIRVTEDTIRPAETLASVPVELPAVAPDSTSQQQSVSVLDQGRQRITRLFVSSQQAIHDVNLNRDTLYRDWQVSFLPFIGTNHRLSGRISNRISVNILMGYSFGVRAFEVGGLMNLVRTDVQGFQAGGLANIVGGKVTGVQLGGLANYTNREVVGVQAGGLLNTGGKTVTGAQVAGLVNFANQEVQGGQIGGLLNIAGRSVEGIQLAGLVNYAQADVQGWQIGGILNRARRVTKGLQIGLINIADSVGSVPIGLLSFVRKDGYQRIEVAATEVNVLNVTLRTGTKRLYNILTAGHSFDRLGSPRLSAGYGLGTAFTLSRATLLNLEGTYHHLFYFDRVYQATNGWNNQIRLSTLIEAKLSRHVSLAFGPSVNWYFSTDGTTQPLLQPEVSLFADRTDAYSNAHHWGWIGFQVGLRFGNS